MIDEVMFEIRELTGQVYKNVYAGKTADAEIITPSRVGNVNEPVVDRRVASDSSLGSGGVGIADGEDPYDRRVETSSAGAEA